MPLIALSVSGRTVPMVLTFVDGDLVLGPGNPSGQGTLIVTGKLTLDGNFNFNGVIMVLGEGTSTGLAADTATSTGDFHSQVCSHWR